MRRRCKSLLADGLCEPAGEGIRIRPQLLASAAHREALEAGYSLVRALHRRLARAGCIEPMALPPPPHALRSDQELPVRIVWRSAADYFLRTMEMLLPNIPGGLTRGFVLMEVIRANTAEFSDAMRGEDRIDAAAGVPDSYRIPVRTSDVAKRLSLPHETVRRSLAALVESEHCQQSVGGFIVPAAALTRPGVLQAFGPNVQNLRRLFENLAEAGVLARWDAEAPETGMAAARAGGAQP